MPNTYCYYCPRCRRRRPIQIPAAGRPFAEPACPSCAGMQVMRRYATTDMSWPASVFFGKQPTETEIDAMVQRMPPIPPGPPPTMAAAPMLDAAERVIYSGHGVEGTRGRVLYKLTENAAKMLCTVFVDFNTLAHDSDATTARIAFYNGLLKARPVVKDSLVHPPVGSSAGAWAVITAADLADGVRGTAWGLLPNPLQIGIAIGNERFGLIHLLAGHSGTINTFMGSNVGKELVFRLDKPGQEDVRINMSNGLEALLGSSFGASKLAQITHAGSNKFVLRSRDNRKLVIDRQGAAPMHTITTLYGADSPFSGGAIVWSRN